MYQNYWKSDMSNFLHISDVSGSPNLSEFLNNEISDMSKCLKF